MADNVAISAGTGTNIATDDVGGVQYQRVKIAVGADGVAADNAATAPLHVRLSDGSASLSALPITDNSGSITVDNAGTFSVQSSAVIPGTGATNLGKAEDAAHASGDTGVMALAVRSDTAASTAGTTGDYQPLITDVNGKLWVNAAITSGSAVAGTAGSASVDVLTVQGASGMTPVQAQDVPATSGGYTKNYLLAPATPAKNAVKASAGQLYQIHAFNLLATPVYLKMWDIASGSVTLGTTACDIQWMIPGNTGGAGFIVNLPAGTPFATAITTAVTLSISATDNTSITANSVIVNLFYK